MKRVQAFKFELRPTGEQERQMRWFCHNEQNETSLCEAGTHRAV
jgi:hypothetical protein